MSGNNSIYQIRLKGNHLYLEGIEKKDLTEKIKIIKEDIIEI